MDKFYELELNGRKLLESFLIQVGATNLHPTEDKYAPCLLYTSSSIIIGKPLTSTLNSRMERPPKSVLLQYIYDYGLDKAAALFHIDTETADKIINWKPQYDQYSYNTVIDKPLHRNASKIANIIAKHYPELVKQYTTYYKDTIYMSQTVEDFLQKAVIRCMEVGLEEVTEESVLALLRVQFNTIRCYAKKSSYTMTVSYTHLSL